LVRVLAVNNYPTAERFDRLARALEGAGARVTVARWDRANPRAFDGFDGVVLSGSPDMMSAVPVQKKYSAEMRALRECKVPVLGVCFGHQMIACAFGSRVVKDREHVLGFVRTELLSRDRLFEGIPGTAMLLESRHEIVESLPRGFDLLASSEKSAIAAMKHARRPIYGVQSHPERYSRENPEGKAVIANFVRLIA
jgi:GMP synthase (glutamine-hydrolysing)